MTHEADVILPIVDRAEWLTWRLQDVTASDIGAVAGVDPYRSPLRIYGEKTGAIVADSENNIMRRGRWLEAAILEALREELPDWRIEKAGIYLRSTSLRLGATPDFLAEHPDEPEVLVNIQGKVVSRSAFEERWSDERVPLGYQLQTLAEGMLLGAGLNMVAALVIDQYSADLVLREVPRHAEAEQRIREIAAQFWQNVAEGRRPAADYAKDADTIEALHAHAEAGAVIDLSGDNRLANLLPERERLKKLMTDAATDLQTIDTEIKDKIGANEKAIAGAWKLTWKEEFRKAYSVAASSRRVLRVSPVKEKAA